MKLNKILCMAIILVIMLIAGTQCVFAESKISNTSSDACTVSDYRIEIEVKENNTMDVTEIVSVKYNTDKHEFIRKIPLKNVIKDGKEEVSNKTRVKNLIIDEDFTLARENSYEVIKIKDKNINQASRTYTIKYTYDLGEDKFYAKDKFYYSIIGDNRNYNIENLSFTITMPKEFNSKYASAYIESIDGKEDINYNIRGNIISGYYKRNLYPSQRIVVDIDLENQYFVGTNKNIDVLSLLIMVISAAFVLVADRLWTRYGKNVLVAEIIDSMPPDNLNPVEVDYIHKGFAKDRSVAALLLHLANKGYIKIENRASKVSIARIKFYDGNNDIERLFMDKIFPRNIEKNIISFKDLRKRFYAVSELVKNKADSKENRNRVFEVGVSEKANLLIVMVGTIFGLINIKPTIEYLGEFPIMIYVLFHIVALWVALKSYYKREKLDKILSLLLAFGFEMVVWSSVTLPILQDEPVYFVASIVAVICMVTIAIFSHLFTKRTKYGNEMLGRVKGFKEFLENMNSDEIEKISRIDENYFYNIFPYAYALGMEKKLIEKYSKTDLKAPDWYVSSEEFTLQNFAEFIDTYFKFASTGIVVTK